LPGYNWAYKHATECRAYRVEDACLAKWRANADARTLPTLAVRSTHIRSLGTVSQRPSGNFISSRVMTLTLDQMALTGLFMSIGRPAKWKSCQAVNQSLIIFEVGCDFARSVLLVCG